MECSARLYEHKPQVVCQNASGEVTLYWNQHTATGFPVVHNKPDVVVANSKTKTWTIIDFAVPLDKNVVLKEREKIETYQTLAQEVRKTYKVKTEIIPIVMGALDILPTRLPEYVKKLGIPHVVGGLQNTALLGTQRILENVLSL